METLTRNPILKLFEEKRENVLSVYFTAGYPQLDDTVQIIQSLDQAGVDLIEVGVPFSDPVADGPTIQGSNDVALKNGMNLKLLFSQLGEIKGRINTPLLLMGYINPVLQYGIEKFCQACEKNGISGLILPDLPIEEYVKEYKSVFEHHGLLNIFLITPQTREERIREIDEQTRGFIYMVSTASTTGARDAFEEEQYDYFKRIQAMKLRNPTLIGFGISNNKTYKLACRYSSGAIIGSAFVKHLKDGIDLKEDITEFVNSIKQGEQ